MGYSVLNKFKNFFSFFKKKESSASFFIFISLAALVIFPALVLTLNTMLAGGKKENNSYFFKDEIIESAKYDISDPLVTKARNFKNTGIKKPIINENDPLLGDKNSSVTIVEYSDFNCLFCQKQEKILKNILEEFKGKVKLIWKDYPENKENSPSFQYALAARCAAEENMFWEFHDRLFKENNQNVINVAEDLKLNKKKFKECLKNEKIKSLIFNNIAEADALDITGVPFIYVNEQEIMGEISYEELKIIIEAELKK